MAEIWLFDIDNTLIFTGGAGSRALSLAFAEVFGISDGLTGIPFAGRTDIAILRDALKLHNVDGDVEPMLNRFKVVYYRYLAVTLPQAENERNGRVLPGVRGLLEKLSTRSGSVLGIATGNFQQAAAMKLRHYGLERYFSEGAYGDDIDDRIQLVAAAIARMKGRAGNAVSQVYILGDTPLDVAGAKANGAFAIGVATGTSSEAELRESGADLVLSDLSGWQILLRGLTAADA